jgi:hypothetical protein
VNLLPAFVGAPTENAVYHTDALTLLSALPNASVDVVVTDPPYAEIERDYGRLTETEWMEIMTACVREFRRVLKPTGSAVMILQPNSEHVGKMRLWLWRFMVWCGEHWNIVQDAYWWNTAAVPTVHCQSEHGLMRPSVKTAVWVGNPDCYRDQSAVLWRASYERTAANKADHALETRPSGYSIRAGRMQETAGIRGGTTPYNLLPVANTNSRTSAGALGHGAGTASEVVDWWIRYLSKPGDLVLDPFMGTGTTALRARENGRRFIGCDLELRNVEICNEQLRAGYTLPLFARLPPRKNAVSA